MEVFFRPCLLPSHGPASADRLISILHTRLFQSIWVSIPPHSSIVFVHLERISFPKFRHCFEGLCNLFSSRASCCLPFPWIFFRIPTVSLRCPYMNHTFPICLNPSSKDKCILVILSYTLRKSNAMIRDDHMNGPVVLSSQIELGTKDLDFPTLVGPGCRTSAHPSVLPTDLVCTRLHGSPGNCRASIDQRGAVVNTWVNVNCGGYVLSAPWLGTSICTETSKIVEQLKGFLGSVEHEDTGGVLMECSCTRYMRVACILVLPRMTFVLRPTTKSNR